MAQAPVMPLWTDALIADTTHLSPREFGCYMLLLIATWRNNGQPFADNDKILARICRMPTYEWKNQIRKSLEPFFNLADGYWRQKRLEKEWTFCSARRRTSRSNGAMGGRPSKAKPLGLNGSHNPAGSSQANLDGTQTEPALNLNLLGSDEPNIDRAKALSPARRARSAEQEFSSIYALYPRHVGRGAALKAFIRARQTVDLDTLQHAVERYAEQRAGEDPRYTPHMATWLNAQRWADEDDRDQPNPQGGQDHDDAARQAGLEEALRELRAAGAGEVRQAH